VRRAFSTPLANIDLHGAESVDREALVGINGDAEETRVCIDQLILVPDNRVPENTGITKIGQIGHIFSAVKFGRVRLTDLILLEHLYLTANIDFDLGAILGINESLEITTINLLVVDPDRLLGVVGLGLELFLQLKGDA
jgi:hypothetical protein